MPWVLASCGSQQVGSFSGWDLAAGTKIETFLGSYEALPGEPILFFIPFVALVVLSLAYRYWKKKQLAKIDGIGVILLGLLPLGLLLFFSDAKAEVAREGITLKYLIGVWGTIIGYIAVTIGGFLNMQKAKHGEEPVNEFGPIDDQ
jgi:uncharacterized membrane protein